jgi:NAD(P)-dependent dehydrogenase (short-subunit alcohol dehydrogenase family)
MAEFSEGAAVVFGGSGGIGRGVALEFGRAGTAVAICYRSKADVASEVAAEVRALGVAASVHQVDVRDRAAIDSARDGAIAAHGRVHSVIWGAGPLVPQVAISEWSDEQFRQAVEVEAFGFHHAARSFIPHFREQGGGAFVHLGSAGHDWWPKRDGLSVAPKAINESLVKGIAKEEGRNEIRANSILVGVIDAGMFHVLTEQGAFDDQWVEETRKLLALKRWGKAEDIGRAAVFLASHRANYVTGQTISVSGGFGV